MSALTSDEWLQKLFADSSKQLENLVSSDRLKHPIKIRSQEDVLQFERNSVTQQILDGIHGASQFATKQTEEEVKILKVLTEEFTAEGTRLTNILETIKVNKSNLPMDLTELVNVVSASSLQLQTVEQISDDTSDAVVDTSFNLVQSLQRLQNLEKIRESLNEMRLKDCHDQAAKKREAEFLSKKTSEYAGHIRHLEKKLEAVGYQPEIRHGALDHRAKQLKTASEKLMLLRSKLNVYSDLTPDISLARIQVQNLKDELTQIESQISENISSIHS